MRVVGVGHNCVDRLCVVESYPPEDGSTHITSISVQGGGACSTALVALSRLGFDTALIGNIGYDRVSDESVELFRQDGVSTDYLVRRHDTKGLESFVMVNPANGTRTKFPQKQNQPDIEWTEGLKEVVRKADALHLDGTGYANALNAASIAREAGVPVSLDGCSMQKDNALNQALASMADILIMNWKYALRVSGKTGLGDALLEMSGWGPKVVGCTVGNEGSWFVVGGKVRSFGIFPVPVADTTGAGDAFHGGFLAAWLNGLSLEEAVWYATAVASIKCTMLGGRAGLPDASETQAFLLSHFKKGDNL